MTVHAVGSSFVWNGVTVASIDTINGVEISLDLLESTVFGTPDNYKTQVPGLLDAGEVVISGFLTESDTTGQLAMVTDMNARTLRTASVNLPASTGCAWSFSAYITKLKIAPDKVNGLVPFSASIKPQGKPTFSTTVSTGLTTPFFSISNSAVVIPAASGSVYTYTASVLTAVTSVTVTPTATAGTITVNGNTVATGVPSSAIVLGSAGSVTPITIVVTETNKAPKTYTIYLARA